MTYVNPVLSEIYPARVAVEGALGRRHPTVLLGINPLRHPVVTVVQVAPEPVTARRGEIATLLAVVIEGIVPLVAVDKELVVLEMGIKLKFERRDAESLLT